MQQQQKNNEGVGLLLNSREQDLVRFLGSKSQISIKGFLVLGEWYACLILF